MERGAGGRLPWLERPAGHPAGMPVGSTSLQATFRTGGAANPRNLTDLPDKEVVTHSLEPMSIPA